MSTLADIRTKVRRITRSPQEAQLSTANLDNYINTFVLYDLPEQLRLEALRQTLTFYTTPYVDTYSTNTTDVNDPLYEFKNKYVSVHQPAYIAGYPVWYTQSRQEFFASYPMTNSIQQIGTGDGLTNNFTGTLQNKPVLRNSVTFVSIDANNNAVTLKDSPINNTNGNVVVPNETIDRGDINYVTGVYDITFAQAPAAGQTVYSETVPYNANRPVAILYYNYEFTVRPVPDKAYAINLEVYTRPTELLAAGESPTLKQWWQYIALGAAKKIFEDRTKYDSLKEIMPTYEELKTLVERSTLDQLEEERTATIYTQQTSLSSGPGGWNNFGL